MRFIEIGGRLIKRADVARASVINDGNKKKADWKLRVWYYDSVPPSGYESFCVPAKSEQDARERLIDLQMELEET